VDEGLIAALPKFVAAVLSRVPSIRPEDVDVSVLLRKVYELEGLVLKHDKMLQSHDTASTMTPPCPALLPSTFQVPANEAPAADFAAGVDAEDVQAAANNTWAGVAMANNSHDSWSTVIHRKKKRFAQVVAPVFLRSKKSVDSAFSKVKTVSSRHTAFVSRIDKDTTSDDLCEFLKQAGIKDVECIKLVPKDGKVFKSAAFRVSCSDVSRDLFYNEDMWPEGCLLRDWYFKGKGQASTRSNHADNPSHGSN